VKKVLYIDMDGVIVDFESGIKRISAEEQREYEGRLDDVPGIFALMDPMPGALEAYRELSHLFDTYILSTAPWENVSAWSDKLVWVKQHLGGHPGDDAYKRHVHSDGREPGWVKSSGCRKQSET